MAVNPENNLPGRMEYAGIDFGRSARDPDRNNWGPRFGFALDLTGKGQTVLRGGYSVFYSQIVNTSFFGSTAGFASSTTTYQPPGNNSNLQAFRFSEGLPYAPIEPEGPRLGPSAFLGQNVTYEEAAGEVPMSQQWGLALQQRVNKWMLEVSYSANRVTHMSAGNYDLNQLIHSICLSDWHCKTRCRILTPERSPARWARPRFRDNNRSGHSHITTRWRCMSPCSGVLCTTRCWSASSGGWRVASACSLRIPMES